MAQGTTKLGAALALALAATLGLGACSVDRTTGDRALTGAAVGAAGGAAVGLLTGNVIGSAARGAVGGAAGGFVYDQIKKR
jgi:osmotically inducible lipoprotein OsmB